MTPPGPARPATLPPRPPIPRVWNTPTPPPPKPSTSGAPPSTSRATRGPACSTPSRPPARPQRPRRLPPRSAPGLPLGPRDLVPRPATPTLPGAGSPAVAAPAALPTYTIKSGDNLTSIALEFYGSGNHWVQIAQANPLVDPDRLKVGQVIKLPGPAGTTPTIPPAATPDHAPPPDVGGGTEYTVKENDTLSGIAKQFYNAASKWQLIYEANRSVIGSNPARMKPGTVLRIPPPDNGAR